MDRQRRPPRRVRAVDRAAADVVPDQRHPSLRLAGRCAGAGHRLPRLRAGLRRDDADRSPSCREADPVVSALVLGGLLGAVAGTGLLLVAVRLSVLRRPQLSARVLPYLRDLPVRDQGPALRTVSSSPTSAAAGIFGPSLRSAADLVERVLGGSS